MCGALWWWSCQQTWAKMLVYECVRVFFRLCVVSHHDDFSRHATCRQGYSNFLELIYRMLVVVVLCVYGIYLTSRQRVFHALRPWKSMWFPGGMDYRRTLLAVDGQGREGVQRRRKDKLVLCRSALTPLGRASDSTVARRHGVEVMQWHGSFLFFLWSVTVEATARSASRTQTSSRPPPTSGTKHSPFSEVQSQKLGGRGIITRTCLVEQQCWRVRKASFIHACSRPPQTGAKPSHGR